MKLQLAAAKRFGRSSEKYVDPNDPQSDLFSESELDECAGDVEAVPDEEENTSKVKPHVRKNRGKRQPLPTYLPVERIEYTLPESELVGPNGEVYVKIGEDISQQLDIVPATVRIIEHVRFKYAVKELEELGVKIAPITGQPIPKSLASSGLLAHIAQSKYQYHLPLYRQEQIWKSLDVHLPRNSLSRWMIEMGERVGPLIECLLTKIKQHPHIHVDETPVTVLKDDKQKPDNPSHKGYIWVYTNKYGTLFDYQSDRAGINPESKLLDFKGYVQTDAYSGYFGLFTKESGKQSVGCFAHARRKFTDVQKAAGKNKKSPIADYVVKQISGLYKIEKYIRDEDLTIGKCYQKRQTEAIPILDKLHEFLLGKKQKVPPKGLIGKAIAYSLNHWPELIRYCDDGILNIDNNPAEGAIRPFAVGRKNWLFLGNTRSAQAAANIYSLIESAKFYNLKVFDYLKFVFEVINQADTKEKLGKLLPCVAHYTLPKMKDLKKS